MAGLRPGGHALNALSDAGAAAGYGALYPQNNIANAYDSGTKSKVYAEDQMPQQALYIGQNAQQNAISAQQGQMAEAHQLAKGQDRAISDKENQVQLGLNQALAAVATTRLATGGQHLADLKQAQDTIGEQEFARLIKTGQRA